jgi:rfaE bifunctional protein nucleotidyltransferase chain/domain
MQLADCDAMLVTQSEHGMTLVPRGGEAIHVPAHAVRVRDVSGAGDTGADWETALRMATAAAAVAVRLKGEGRPVQDERARADVLTTLEAVDLVVIFEEDTPIKLITQIKPSALVKGGDYSRAQVVGHEIVEAHGGEVLLVEVLPGFSTTSLVNRAREGKA